MIAPACLRLAPGTGRRTPADAARHADDVLVSRLVRGESGATAELARRFGTRIQAIAFRCLRNHEDAEEVAQDVLMKVLGSIACFRRDAALGSWIYRIAFNTAISRLRRTRQMRKHETSWDGTTADGHDDGRSRDVADAAPGADELYLGHQLRAHIAVVLETLPVIYRRPVALRDLQDLSTAAAGEVLGIGAQTLKSRLHRGRLLIRPGLAPFRGGWAGTTHNRA